MKTKQITLSALFICLITVSAFIKIPAPFVPITLQLPVVILSAMLLGEKHGLICILVYISMGLLGLPVFSAGGGFSYIFQPTFGYIAAFIPATVIAVRLTGKHCSFRKVFLGGVFAVLTVHAIGFVYYILISRFYLGNEIDIKALLIALTALTLPKDILMCGALSVLKRRLQRIS